MGPQGDNYKLTTWSAPMAAADMAGYGSVDWHEESSHLDIASTPLDAQATSSRQWRARGIMLVAAGALGFAALSSKGTAAPDARGTLLKETPTLGGRPGMSTDLGSSSDSSYDPNPSEVSSNPTPLPHPATTSPHDLSPHRRPRCSSILLARHLLPVHP